MSYTLLCTGQVVRQLTTNVLRCFEAEIRAVFLYAVITHLSSVIACSQLVVSQRKSYNNLFVANKPFSPLYHRLWSFAAKFYTFAAKSANDKMLHYTHWRLLPFYCYYFCYLPALVCLDTMDNRRV